MSNEVCPLCKHEAKFFFADKKRVFLICSCCLAVFSHHRHLPDREAEKTRYEEHNNDVNDLSYQEFVRPIVDEIRRDFLPSHSGLDFGAGTGPVISKLLADKAYQVKQYDPFFHNYPNLLDFQYDYIVCCEVIEHFHQPAKEFHSLKRMLSKNGKLYCMTSLYNKTIDFKSWYYKNDATHVFFYQLETLEYIRQKFGFSALKVDKNLIILSC